MPKSAQALKLQRGDKKELESIIRKPTRAHRDVKRARIILLASQGLPNAQISRLTSAHRNQVIEWRRRYEQLGLEGLSDHPRSGRPTLVKPRDIQTVVNKVCRRPPSHISRWSVRTLAQVLKMPKSTVHQVLQDCELHPHRLRTFNFSPDPYFEEKLLEVVGLYMKPPNNALVLCVDEKTGIQALDRTQPILPLRSKKPRSWSNEYVRHGTRTLLASLEIATGKVTAWVNKTRKSKDFISFMNRVVQEYPNRRLCVVLDNLNTHKGQAVEKWLEQNPQVSFHYTPTHASWVNLIECFFSILTRQGLQQAVHRSVRQLTKFLYTFVEQYNKRCGPFEWTKGPEKLQRIIQLTKEFQKTYVH